MTDRHEAELNQHENAQARKEEEWMAGREERLEEARDTIRDEIDCGLHDDELANSVLIDSTLAMRVARIEMMNAYRTFRHGRDHAAIRDLKGQINDYVQDLAERRERENDDD